MSDTNRLIDAIRRLIRAELDHRGYPGIYEYSIQGASAQVVTSAIPTDSGFGLPSVANVPIISSPLGENVTPTVGKLCRIMFVNGSPTRPVVVSCDAPDTAATVETSGDLSFVAGGMVATENVATVQAVYLALINLPAALGSALKAVIPPAPTTTTTQLGDALIDPTFAAKMAAALNTAIAGQASPVPIAPYLNTVALVASALNTALDSKLPDTTGLLPGVGCPAVKAG